MRDTCARRPVHPLLSGASLVILSVGLAACSTSYTPKPSQRIAVGMEGGNRVLLKDGRAQSIGIFGGGLEDAVADNPRAADHADSYGNLMIGGFVVNIIGGAASGLGTYLFIDNELDTTPDETLRGVSLGIGLGGLAMSIIGGFLQLEAQTHLYDAVNVYNDGVDSGSGNMPSGVYPAPGYGVPGYGPPGYGAGGAAPADPYTGAPPNPSGPAPAPTNPSPAKPSPPSVVPSVAPPEDPSAGDDVAPPKTDESAPAAGDAPSGTPPADGGPPNGGPTD